MTPLDYGSGPFIGLGDLTDHVGHATPALIDALLADADVQRLNVSREQATALVAAIATVKAAS